MSEFVFCHDCNAIHPPGLHVGAMKIRVAEAANPPASAFEVKASVEKHGKTLPKPVKDRVTSYQPRKSKDELTAKELARREFMRLYMADVPKAKSVGLTVAKWRKSVAGV